MSIEDSVKGTVTLLREVASSLENGEATLTFVNQRREVLPKRRESSSEIEELVITGEYTIEVTYKNVEEAKKCIEAFSR